MADLLQSRKPVLGLIGGIGSGKSLVASLFAERGGRVISGDALGHEALRDAAIKARVVQRWGPGILTPQGEVDRRRLGAIVFGNDTERRDLEAIVFPYIERRLQEEIGLAESASDVRLVVMDAAVMLEAGWSALCDRLVFVDTPLERRMKRLLDQRGWTVKEVEARERAQWPVTEKKSRADALLDNSGPAKETARQVDELIQRWGLPSSSLQSSAVASE